MLRAPCNHKAEIIQGVIGISYGRFLQPPVKQAALRWSF